MLGWQELPFFHPLGKVSLSQRPQQQQQQQRLTGYHCEIAGQLKRTSTTKFSLAVVWFVAHFLLQEVVDNTRFKHR